MRFPFISMLLAGTMLMTGANSPLAQETRSAPPASAPAKAQIGTFGFDEEAMDRSVTPGDDFFTYANGRGAVGGIFKDQTDRPSAISFQPVV